MLIIILACVQFFQHKLQRDLHSVSELAFGTTFILLYLPDVWLYPHVPLEFLFWLTICALFVVIVKTVQAYDDLVSPDISKLTRTRVRVVTRMTWGYLIVLPLIICIDMFYPGTIMRLINMLPALLISWL